MPRRLRKLLEPRLHLEILEGHKEFHKAAEDKHSKGHPWRGHRHKGIRSRRATTCRRGRRTVRLHLDSQAGQAQGTSEPQQALLA